jgi:hypothetical protein
MPSGSEKSMYILPLRNNGRKASPIGVTFANDRHELLLT